MVWIHGGAFYLGSGDAFFYGPDYIIQKDVILVTLNYRLGPLGMLFVISICIFCILLTFGVSFKFQRTLGLIFFIFKP